MAAKSMNVTTDELNKLLKAGKVASKDFLPAFSKELARVGRASGATDAGINSLRGSQVSFNRAIQDTVLLFKELGSGEGMKGIFIALTDIIKGLTPVVLVLAAAFTTVFAVIKLMFAPIDFLANLLGFEGGGLGAIVLLLSSILIGRLVSSLAASAAALLGVKVQASGAAMSLLSVGIASIRGAVGVGFLTKAMAIARVAALSLWTALGPIGAIFAGAGALAGLAIGTGLIGGGDGPSSSSTSKSSQSVNNNSNSVVNNEFNINTSANADEVAKVVEDTMANQYTFAPNS